MDDWGVARPSGLWGRRASCLSRDGLAVGSLSCRDSAGETPARPTGSPRDESVRLADKMRVLP